MKIQQNNFGKANIERSNLKLSLFLSIALAILNITGNAQTQFGTRLVGTNDYDIFGHAVSLSLDGKRMAVGVPWYDNGGGVSDDYGGVNVYEWDGSSWSQLGSTIVGTVGGDKAGWGISLSGDGTTVAVGSYAHQVGSNPGAGHARMFKWNGSSWSQMGSAIEGQGDFTHDGFSLSLSCDGTKLALGAYKHIYSGYKGKTRMFSYNGTSWSQMGSDIIGEADNDYSGWVVSISGLGTRVAISAKSNAGGGVGRGHVRIFNWNGSAWSQLGSDIDGEADYDYSGHAMHMSADGSTVAIGAYNNAGNGGAGRGHCRVYRWSGSAWTKLGSDLDGVSDWDYSGYSVALSTEGNIVAVGAINNSGPGNQNGEVRVYSYNGSSWSQVGLDMNGTNVADHFGSSVSLSRDGSRLAIGATDHDNGGTNRGQVTVFRFNNSDSMATCENSPLPVQLLGFEGLIKNQDAVLSWSTASEINNEKFEIEKSENGKEFVTIGEVLGGGNSNHILNYHFSDNDAFDTKLTHLFYRLKQIDYNGSFEYSEIIALNMDKLTNRLIPIHPNPFNECIHINLTRYRGEITKVSLVNAQGQIITEINNLMAKEGLLQINTIDLPSGIYYLLIQDDVSLSHVKLLKN